MTYLDFVASALASPALHLCAVVLGVSLLVVLGLWGSVSAAFAGSAKIAHRAHWAWNLIYVPVVLGAGALVVLLAGWLLALWVAR